MRPLLKISALLILGLTVISPRAYALTVLRQEDAKNYLGDLKAHLSSGRVTYDILSRNHRDAMHSRFSDGVLFNSAGGKFLYLRRKDGDYQVVINSPQGREKEPVNEENWRQKINNALSDDNSFAYVFLDESKKELALVFVGRGTQVTGRMNTEGLLEISISVEGTGDRSRMSGRRY